MKTDSNGCSISSAALIPIHFEFQNPDAVTVYVAGTFNKWQPAATPLTRGYGGHWGKFTALRAGTYEYCLIVDEHWILDPMNQASVANPFGGRNSVLTVSHSTAEPSLFHAEYLPAHTQLAFQKGFIDKTVVAILPDASLISAATPDLPESTVLHSINAIKSP